MIIMMKSIQIHTMTIFMTILEKPTIKFLIGILTIFMKTHLLSINKDHQLRHQLDHLPQPLIEDQGFQKRKENGPLLKNHLFLDRGQDP
jgi:hypothetical protein